MMAAAQWFDGKCYRCGKRGHKSANCFAKSESTKWCQKCKNKSHNTKDCRAGKRDTAKTVIGPAEGRGISNISHSFAFIISEHESSRGKVNSNLLVDTGATSHIISDKAKFTDCDEKFYPNNHVIELADGKKLNVVLGKGNAQVKLYDVNVNLRDVALNNGLYIPSYGQNIFSVPSAIENGATISLDEHAKYLKPSDPTALFSTWNKEAICII